MTSYCVLLVLLSIVALSEASSYCSEYQVFISVNNQSDSNSAYQNNVFSVNSTVQISTGPNLTTQVTFHKISQTYVDSGYMENYTLTDLKSHGGFYLLNSCSLNNTDDCTLDIPHIISRIGFVIDIFDGKNNSHVEIMSGIPHLLRGEAIDHIGSGLYAYSTFQSERTVTNITGLHSAYIHVNTDCLEYSKAKINVSFNPNLGTCKNLFVNFNVSDAKNQLNFWFSGNITQVSANNQAYFNISTDAEYQKTNFNASFYDSVTCSNQQIAYANQPNFCFHQINGTNINSTSPIFWTLGFFLQDLNSNGTYETSGALPLVLACNGPNNQCSSSTKFQLYAYDQFLSENDPNYAISAPVFYSNPSYNDSTLSVTALASISCNQWEMPNENGSNDVFATNMIVFVSVFTCLFRNLIFK